jgi:hypothetical protein
MKTDQVTACVIAVSLVTAGCTKPPATKSPVSPMSAGSFELYPCSTSAPNPATDQQYSLTLGPNFQMRNADAPHGGHREGPRKSIPNHNPTLMDIFTQLNGTSGSQWATVTIQIQQPPGQNWLHLRTDGVAVRGGEKGAQDVFCDVKLDPTGAGTPQYDPQWVSFRTHRDGTAETYGTYNLGLIVKDEKPQNSGYELPVFIDPGVDNEG